MGTICSKHCGKENKKKRYEKKEERGIEGNNDIKPNDQNHVPKPGDEQSGSEIPNGQPSQPVNNESVRHYAINNGGKTELDKGDDENMKQNNYVPPNIGNNEEENNERKKKRETEKEEKKERKDGKKRKKKKTRGKKKKKNKYWSDSSDSSWSSSSSSSSDDDTGKTSRSKQKKTDKDGNVTYIRNKTTIGSSKISFKAAKNVNIYNNKTINQSPAGNTRKLFTKEYTAQTAKMEEANLYSIFRNNKPASGQFIDLRGRLNVQTAFQTGVLYDCTHWVGQIVFPPGTCTCFRVGQKYIMTALHAITRGLESVDYNPVHASASQGTEANLRRLSDHSIFVDFTYLTENQQRQERNKFYFKHIQGIDEIPFYDEETDTIVLELLHEPNKPLPHNFTIFGIPALDRSFHLITHSSGRPKELDKVFMMVDKNSTQTVDEINFLNTESRRFLQGKNVDPNIYTCETRPYDILANQNRHLFHCASTKGASGSPGVQISPSGQVVVVTMLLHGYPDWYYSDTLSSDTLRHLRDAWPEHYTIEQGVDFASVCNKMRIKNSALCNEIFPDVNQTTDSTIHSVRAVPPTD